MSVLAIEDAKVLVYIATKNNDYTEVNKQALNLLDEWLLQADFDAKTVLHYWVRSCPPVARNIFVQLHNRLEQEESVERSLEFLEDCSMPSVSDANLLNSLWTLLGTTENPQVSEQVAHAIVILLPSYVRENFLAFSTWWGSIVASLSRSNNLTSVNGLKAWLSCLTNSQSNQKFAAQSKGEIVNTMVNHGRQYFSFIETKVSQANKIALQILDYSLSLLTTPISNDCIEFDPMTPGARDAWRRYASLVEILGIDTSIHQTSDSLTDFAALLSDRSPIPPNWSIALINVGLCRSNNEGIRVLVMHLVMALQPNQLIKVAKFPAFVARTLFPKFLQTPNFVILNDRCLQAEHLQEFTRNILLAFLAEGLSTLQEFVYEFSQYLLEHAHCFEAPRVLIVKTMLDVLPANCLSQRECISLLAAARATVLTYNSKALADLYFELAQKVVAKCESGSQQLERLSLEDEESASVKSLATEEWKQNGFLNLVTLRNLKRFCNLCSEFTSEFALPELNSDPTIFDMQSYLQFAYLQDSSALDKSLVKATVESELNTRRALNAEERKRLGAAMELAFDYIDSISLETCLETFSTFSDLGVRFSALRCYKRAHPRNVALEEVEKLWSHIKDATLRIIDREFHLCFIDLITTPGFVKSPESPVDICLEIVDMSALKRNLLVPLAQGLTRFPRNGVPAWVLTVMAHIFVFIKSPEYTVRLEEMIAKDFKIYEKNWGKPESHGRAIAAIFLRECAQHADSIKDACDECVREILELAKLDERITGSLDNIEAHKRVLYYQVLLILQFGCSKKCAMDILAAVQESLEFEANPPVRMQAEWLVGVISLHHLAGSENELSAFILKAISDLKITPGVPPRVLSSQIRICMLLYYSASRRKSMGSTTLEKIGEALVLQLVPLATSNKAVVRHRAISALYILDINGLAPSNLKHLVKSIASLNAGGVRNSSYQNETYLWDIMDAELGPVCGGICSTVFDRYMPNTLLESDFEGIKTDFVGQCWSDEQIVKAGRRGDPTFPDVIEYRERIVQEAVANSSSREFCEQIQTKSGTFDVEYQARRTSLIVVATLCDKPVNLGAITRLSDALGVSRLAVKDLSVLSDPQYKSTSLTAEKWIPMEEVKETQLCEYLLRLKADGYTLVGIEQTDTSMKLNADLQFPEKTVLLMGHERQGIPADLLSILDACIEIEQLGYVRSMNIQTATAVVVHAYNQKHSNSVQRVGYAK